MKFVETRVSINSRLFHVFHTNQVFHLATAITMTALLRTLSILLFLLTISSALYLKGGETKYLVSLPSGWAGVGDPYVITDPVISTEPNFMWNIWIYIPINSTTVRAKICRGQTCIARRTFNGQLVLGQEPLWKAPDYLLIEDPVIPYHYKLVADHVLSYCDPIYTTACDYAPPADGSVLVQNIIVREVHINVPVLDIGVTNASSTWDSGSAITSWVGRPYAGASLYTRITCIDLPLNLTVSGAMWGVEIWYTFSQKNIAGLKQVEVRMSTILLSLHLFLDGVLNLLMLLF
jgi:hypothetical protein